MGMQGTYDDWRLDLLARIQGLQNEGVTRFRWSTAGDAHVCDRCRARHGKVYDVAGLRMELRGAFCRPGDPDDRCRCTIVAAF